MFKDYNLTRESVYFMTPPDNYKGLDYINMVARNFGWFTRRDEETVMSRKMVRYYMDLLDTSVFPNAIEDDEITYNHPVIHLQKGSGYTSIHDLTLKTFATHASLKKDWTCMAFNGKGTMLYSDFFVHNDDYGIFDGQYDTITINGVEESKPDDDELAGTWCEGI